MKRKIAWLALPLILFALIWGVKWRADNSSPTELDLKIRVMMLASSKITVSHRTFLKSSRNIKCGTLSKQEFKPLINCFHFLHPSLQKRRIDTGTNGIITINCQLTQPRKDGVKSLDIQLNSDSRLCNVLVFNPKNIQIYDFRPTTTKHWIALLLANPRIGPELRKRMNG